MSPAGEMREKKDMFLTIAKALVFAIIILVLTILLIYHALVGMELMRTAYSPQGIDNFSNKLKNLTKDAHF